MEQVKIARIAVSAATYGIDKPYDYFVPEALSASLQMGMRVLVPFGRGNRVCEGIVLSVAAEERSTSNLKAVQVILDPQSVLDSVAIRLALWMRERYFCTMYDAVRAMLPAGLWFRTRTVYRLNQDLSEPALLMRACALGDGAESLIDLLCKHNGCLQEEALLAACGKNVLTLLDALCKDGVLSKEDETVRQVKDGKTKVVALAVTAEEAMSVVAGKQKSAPLRYAVLQMLSTAGPVSQAELCYFTGASSSTISGLKKSGLITVYEEEKLRIVQQQETVPESEICLNEEQTAAFEHIAALTRKDKACGVLLHGVTGSGKTQVYIRLVQEVLSQGKTAIILVPEIALTPQMMRKFTAYFGERVAMLHSALRVTERYDQWKRIRRGEVQVVLGTRSAIFAPLSHIGLIILDEEQEASYQSENPPRYHAREVAQYLCGIYNAVLLLGSATPSIESAWQAQCGVYQYVALRRRYNRHALPAVLLADMKEELRCGNSGIISAPLKQALAENLQVGEQSILLLNRRGSSRMLLCGECGYVPQCPRCSVPLTYHSANDRLMCHYCGHSEPAYECCPVCGGRMKHVGVGTQKAEEELHALFPDVKILRMDADTVAISGGHEKILNAFAQGEAPILLGTQMVAKGLDFENVTLVGVLSADVSLYIDHYCAAERTFSLLTQVIGRAGRGERCGRAIIQTYTPENEVLQCAAQQDYQKFYQSEIRMRKLHEYPPFSDLFTLVLSGADESRLLRAGAVLRDAMRSVLQDGTYDGIPVQILGPAPAPVAKVNNRYRYHIYLIAKNQKRIRAFLEYYLKAFSRSAENRGLSLFVNCNAVD